MDPVRLACVKHAASVRPEPGSNSPSRSVVPAAEAVVAVDRRAGLGLATRCPTGTSTGIPLVRSRGYPVCALNYFELKGLLGRPKTAEFPHSPFGILSSVVKEHCPPTGRRRPERGRDQRFLASTWAKARVARGEKLDASPGGVNSGVVPVVTLALQPLRRAAPRGPVN